MKRGQSGLSGVLAINKPVGMTSHDVVNRVRRVTGEKRVGHAGTLDPAASGVMVVCVGSATRLSNYLMGHDKTYIARIVFGVSTITDDAEGRITEAYTKRKPGEGLEVLEALDAEEVLRELEGESMQLPPIYSAIKKNGVTAYKAAREGKELELTPRAINIYSARLVGRGTTQVHLEQTDQDDFEAELPFWDVELSVSKGTYIRAIARDLGQQLGCGAHLGALQRCCLGDITLDDCMSLEELEAAEGSYQWCDPVKLLGFAHREVSYSEAKFIANGRVLRHEESYADDELVSCVEQNRLLAIYKAHKNQLKPETVLPGGVCGVAVAPSVAVIGVFDGLHNGHRKLLAAAAEEAKLLNAGLNIVTFERDPDELFAKSKSAFKLMRNDERVATLQNFVSSLVEDAHVYAMPVNEKSMAQAPLEFLDNLLVRCNPQSIHVGEGFRFGAQACGTTETMQDYCDDKGIMLHVHPLFMQEDAPISSTRIRELLQEGEVSMVTALKGGHMHKIRGRVVEGRHEGTGFGFATANLDLSELNENVMLPQEGVYACYAQLLDEKNTPLWPHAMKAAVNVGVARSFDEASATIEAHVLDIKENMYGKKMDIWFAEWLREPRVFSSTEELIATVMDNIEWTRKNLVLGGQC